MATAHNSALQISSSPMGPCPLLDKLPAELRNKIYRLVLVQERGFYISRDDAPPVDHALLRTCRKVRAEARSIYWQENGICFEIWNCDVTKLVKWLDISQDHRDLYSPPRSSVNLFFDKLKILKKEIDVWANLLVWVDLYWQHRCRRVNDVPGFKTYNIEPDHVVNFFDHVDRLLVDENMTWKKLVAALGKYRQEIMMTADRHIPTWD